MKVLIFSINYAPEPIGVGKYTADFARGLVEAGHEVTVICAQPYYPGWKIMEGFHQRYRRSTEQGVTELRCPLYVPKSPTGARRLLHHASFAISAFFPVMISALRQRPEIVFATAPSLIAAPVALLAARLSGAKSWLHVQDFEVGAAFATGLLPSRGFVASCASWFERRMMRSFDQVSSISPSMCRRLAAHGIAPERISEFRNSGDVSRILPLVRPSKFRDAWEIYAPYVALYSGNIANKQGLDVVIEAARLLQSRGDILFAICGDGPERPRLESLAAGLPNVVFQGLQRESELEELLGLATVHLLPQRAGTGDHVLPSKLANMLASGRPVIATVSDDGDIAREIRDCGLVVAPEDPHALGTAIAALVDDPPRRARLGQAARARAERFWSREAILPAMIRRLEAVAEQRASGGVQPVREA